MSSYTEKDTLLNVSGPEQDREDVPGPFREQRCVSTFIKYFPIVSIIASIALLCIFISGLVIADQLNHKTYNTKFFDIKFKMSDGVELSGRVYIPKTNIKRLPALVNYQASRSNDLTGLKIHNEANSFASYGLIYIVIDIRGTGESGGEVQESDLNDLIINDGVECVKQILEHERVDKNGVVLIGHELNSLIAAQLSTMVKANALVMIDSPDSVYDYYYPHGQPHYDLYSLAMEHYRAFPSSDILNQEEYIRTRFKDGKSSKLGKIIYKYSKNDPYWTSQSVQHVNVPVFMIYSFRSPYLEAMPGWYRRLNRTKTKVVFGNWGRDEWPDDSADMKFSLRENVVYFSREYVSRLEFGFKLEPDWTIYERLDHGAPGFYRYESFPIKRASDHTYYFSKGKLSAQKDTSGTKEYSYTINRDNYMDFNLGYTYSQKTYETYQDYQRSALDSFTSEKFDADYRILGEPILNLLCSANANGETFFLVIMEEIMGDNATLLSQTSFSVPGIPNPTNNNDTTSEFSIPKTEVKVNLNFVSWTFARGSSFRITIFPSRPPLSWTDRYIPFSFSMEFTGSSSIVLPFVTKQYPALSTEPPFTKSYRKFSWFYLPKSGYYDSMIRGSASSANSHVDAYGDFYRINGNGWFQFLKQKWEVSDNTTRWSAVANQVFVLNISGNGTELQTGPTLGNFLDNIAESLDISKFKVAREGSKLPDVQIESYKYFQLQTDIVISTNLNKLYEFSITRKKSGNVVQ